MTALFVIFRVITKMGQNKPYAHLLIYERTALIQGQDKMCSTLAYQRLSQISDTVEQNMLVPFFVSIAR